MAVLSKPSWSALPEELERMIFLLAGREQHELANYILMAPRMKAWIQPILYRKISIYSDTGAERLIYSLTCKFKKVLYLFLSMSIRPGITSRLLRCCPRLVNLVLYGGISLSKCGMVLQALNDLAYLKFLSIDPPSLFQMHFVYLPNTSVFHHVTHLDLTAHWTSEAIVRGFQFLARLTHLSITWKQARHATNAVRELLHHQNFQMIVLWRDEPETHPVVILDLGLDDPHIVLLHRASRWSLRLDGGFWLHAARIIAWRKQNGIATMERPLFLEDIHTSNVYPDIDYNLFPWEHDHD